MTSLDFTSSTSTSRPAARTRPPRSSPARARRCWSTPASPAPTATAWPPQILDSGKTLTTVFISHADPDFYFGAEVIADAFPDADVRRHPARHRAHPALLRGQAQGLGSPRRRTCPPAWSTSPPLTGDLTLEGHRFELKGGPAGLPDRHYLWQAEHRAILGGVLLFQQEHVWVADTATPERPRRLDRPARRDGRPGPAARRARPPPARHRRRRHRHRRHPRLPRSPSRRSSARPPTAPPLTEALVKRYPDDGMLIAAQIGAKVAKGEMTVGLTDAAELRRPPPRPPTWCAASTSPPPPATWKPCAPPSPPTWSGPRWPASPSPAPTAPPTASPPNVMEQLGKDWDDWTAHDDTYVVDGENVVVLARYTATNKATGKADRRPRRPPLRRPRRTHRPLRTVRRHRPGPRRHDSRP